jgi:hypothetical protein
VLVSRRCFGGLRSARTASRAKTWRDGETCNAALTAWAYLGQLSERQTWSSALETVWHLSGYETQRDDMAKRGQR